MYTLIHALHTHMNCCICMYDVCISHRILPHAVLIHTKVYVACMQAIYSSFFMYDYACACIWNLPPCDIFDFSYEYVQPKVIVQLVVTSHSSTTRTGSVREVYDILLFETSVCHFLVYENYGFALREVVVWCTIILGQTFSYEKSEISCPFVHSLVSKNYCCALREVIARCTIILGQTFSYNKPPSMGTIDKDFVREIRFFSMT